MLARTDASHKPTEGNRHMPPSSVRTGVVFQLSNNIIASFSVPRERIVQTVKTTPDKVSRASLIC